MASSFKKTIGLETLSVGEALGTSAHAVLRHTVLPESTPSSEGAKPNPTTIYSKRDSLATRREEVALSKLYQFELGALAADCRLASMHGVEIGSASIGLNGFVEYRELFKPENRRIAEQVFHISPEGVYTFREDAALDELAEVMMGSFTHCEDDFHGGNFGVYYDSEGKLHWGRIDFGKSYGRLISNDRPFRDSKTQFEYFHHRDLIEFPCLKYAKPFYWPTELNLINAKMNPSKNAYKPRDKSIFEALPDYALFQQGKHRYCLKVFISDIQAKQRLLKAMLPSLSGNKLAIYVEQRVNQIKLSALRDPVFRDYVEKMSEDGYVALCHQLRAQHIDIMGDDTSFSPPTLASLKQLCRGEVSTAGRITFSDVLNEDHYQHPMLMAQFISSELANKTKTKKILRMIQIQSLIAPMNHVIQLASLSAELKDKLGLLKASLIRHFQENDSLGLAAVLEFSISKFSMNIANLVSLIQETELSLDSVTRKAVSCLPAMDTKSDSYQWEQWLRGLEGQLMTAYWKNKADMVSHSILERSASLPAIWKELLTPLTEAVSHAILPEIACNYKTVTVNRSVLESEPVFKCIEFLDMLSSSLVESSLEMTAIDSQLQEKLLGIKIKYGLNAIEGSDLNDDLKRSRVIAGSSESSIILSLALLRAYLDSQKSITDAQPLFKELNADGHELSPLSLLVKHKMRDACQAMITAIGQSHYHDKNIQLDVAKAGLLALKALKNPTVTNAQACIEYAEQLADSHPVRLATQIAGYLTAIAIAAVLLSTTAFICPLVLPVVISSFALSSLQMVCAISAVVGAASGAYTYYRYGRDKTKVRRYLDNVGQVTKAIALKDHGFFEEKQGEAKPQLAADPNDVMHLACV